jgi:basic membrane protein A and related proteins
MHRLARVLLALWAFVFAVSSQSTLHVDSAPSACPPDCSIYIPLTKKPGAQLKIGLVTDTGGVNDGGFNQAAWQAVLDAEANLGSSGDYIESVSQGDFSANINSFISQGYDLIITVGFTMAGATQAAALAHPTKKFTIVDVTYDPVLPNVIGQKFSVEQAAFLSGYLAAGMTATGKVATFGGMNIPVVTQFMDGYYQGVMYYNLENEATVEVLGWDPVTQQGEFTNDFANQPAGLAMGLKLLGEGADIIFPVAGETGLGAAQAVEWDGDAWVIGVDSDWTLTAPDYASVVLTSVLKNVRATTYRVIYQAYQYKFTGGTYFGTLANEGVGLGAVASSVPPALLTEVEQVKADIIAGTIIVTP